jgi:hypothetical protein
MTDILDYISKWSALKWVILVLIAGFIGQFGKMMAQVIIGKIRLARSKKQTQKEIDSPPDIKPASSAASMEKDFPAQSHPLETYPDKKALKILAKESKKAVKKSK